MIRKPLLAVILLALAAPSALAENGAGTSVGEGLFREHIGPRAAAMGGAWTAEAEGTLAQYYNPAGLYKIQNKAVFFQYSNSILEIGRSDIAYAQPFMNGGLSVGLSYVDYGQITRTTTTNKNGAGSIHPSDYLLKVSYGKAYSDRLSWGASLGYYQIDLDDAAAGGITSDLGIHYRLTDVKPITLGASLRNLGTSAKFYRDDEDIPLAFVLGGSWEPNEQWLVTSDLEFSRGQSVDFKAGVEFTPIEIFSLRLGYDGRNDALSDASFGWAAGLGVNWENISLDYAYVPFGDFGAAHRVAAEWEFVSSQEKEDLAAARRAAVLPKKPVEESVRVEAPKPTAMGSAITPPKPPPLPETPTDRAARHVTEGNAFARKGEHARAIMEYEEALAIDQENSRARYNLASTYYASGKYSEAAAHYARLSTTRPDDTEVWLYLGFSHYKLGDKERAVHAWRKVLKINPSHAVARKNLEVLGR